MGGMSMGRVIIIVFASLLMLAGCRQTEYVTVEKTTTDTLYKYKVRVDSVVKFDSITTQVKGDTVYRDRWHTLHVYHNSVDTVWRARIVMEPQPYPVERIVEVNRLKWWQETLMWTGVISLLVLVVILMVRIYKIRF